MNAPNDAQPQQERGHILNELFAAAAKIDTLGAALARGAYVNTTIRGPQMLEQESDLRIAQLKHFARQMLLVRPLIVYAEAFQPSTNTGSVPTIAIAGDDQLMPVAAARMPRHSAAESDRALPQGMVRLV